MIDLVIDPLAYYDALAASIYQCLCDEPSTEHLSSVLPAAIAQLDAVGDEYGALALAGLSAQLAQQSMGRVAEKLTLAPFALAEAY